MFGKQNLNKNLLVLAIVMVVNALSYGTIIPLLYPFASRFGVDAFKLSLLFASFSLAQFIATPVIGRLSDVYGRKNLLLFSLLGTSLSLFLFGSAKSIVWLFIARILDGITGGNISVAQAAIADVTDEKKRASIFGLLGAVFGLGFVAGPALGGILSRFGLSVPFYFASVLALIGVIIGIFLFKETNLNRETKPKSGHLINFKTLIGAFSSPAVGAVLAVSLVSMISANAMIIGFQSFTVDILKLDSFGIGMLFTLFGVITIVMQGFGIKFLTAKISSKRRLIGLSLLFSGIFLVSVATSFNQLTFTILVLIYGVFNSPLNPLAVAMISERTKTEDQGGMLGLNQAYASLAQIIGPLLAGLIAGYSARSVFVFAGFLLLLALWPASRIIKAGKIKEDL